MLISTFIARRFLSKKQNSSSRSLITVIATGGIALGVAVVIIALTILDGFEDSVSEKILNFNSHIKITAFSHQDLPDYREVMPKIKSICGLSVLSVSPFVTKLCIIKSRRSSEAISLNGIEPKLDNSGIRGYVNSGHYNFSPEGQDKAIIIGQKLAEKLHVSPGDRIAAICLQKDQMPDYLNPPMIEQFIVRGIFESDMAEYDDLNAYTDISTAQNLAALGNNISGYNIRLRSIGSMDSIKTALQDQLGYPYYVRTVFQIHQNIFTWLDLQKKPIPIILGLICLVAAFNIVGTLLMVVLEKTNAVGVLRALGLRRKQIMKIFLNEGLLICLWGVLIGDAIALALSLLQKDMKLISLPGDVYFISTVPISIRFINYLIVSTGTLFLSGVISLVPAYIASKISPVKALRFD